MCIENTIYNAKRFIGRSLDENIAVRKNGGETPSGDVFKYASEHPFHTVTIANSSDLYSKIGFQIHRKTSADDKSSGSSSITGINQYACMYYIVCVYIY